jgi:hypothetical protein
MTRPHDRWMIGEKGKLTHRCVNAARSSTTLFHPDVNCNGNVHVWLRIRATDYHIHTHVGSSSLVCERSRLQRSIDAYIPVH